ncbi:MAG: MFS transporter, partial [Acidimicrobiales bacterium]|nr:MFS transporter [Acidimicrobiales bacterium]
MTSEGATSGGTDWGPLRVLAVTQLLMVLDASVMNVSISQLVADFDTTVSSIQGVITFYSLIMAALMITGGRIGDIVGRRRALVIGLTIYASGSALTAASWSVPSLALGWSVLEGVGAALVMPAMAALVATNYEGSARVTAYGVLGGMAGAGIAIGPILGGWFTTNLSWRWVFVGEVLVSLAIIVGSRVITDVRDDGPRPRLDLVGSVLCALGMSVAVFGVLQSSTWGWVDPINSPIEPLGFALTPFVVAAGVAVLYGFRTWERHRERHGRPTLVTFGLFEVPTYRAGLSTLLAQNTVLMGVFFAIPLYLQVVLGLDALDTGVRMLPTSIFMLVVSFSGTLLLRVLSPRGVIRLGLLVMMSAGLLLTGIIEPSLRGVAFAVGMGLLGAGMGLLASQLGNVVLSSVGASDRGEAGGMQYTAQQLGSSLGVALAGSIVLTGLASTYLGQLAADDRIAPETLEAVEVAVASGSSFVPADQVRATATEAALADDEVEALVEGYESS